MQERTYQWEDHFAVAVLKDSNIVHHIPRKISFICSLFLRQSGNVIYVSQEIGSISVIYPKAG